MSDTPKFAVGERVELTRTLLLDAGECPHCGQSYETEQEVKSVHHVSAIYSTYTRGGDAIFSYALDGDWWYVPESDLEAV